MPSGATSRAPQAVTWSQEVGRKRERYRRTTRSGREKGRPRPGPGPGGAQDRAGQGRGAAAGWDGPRYPSWTAGEFRLVPSWTTHQAIHRSLPSLRQTRARRRDCQPGQSADQPFWRNRPAGLGADADLQARGGLIRCSDSCSKPSSRDLGLLDGFCEAHGLHCHVQCARNC